MIFLKRIIRKKALNSIKIEKELKMKYGILVGFLLVLQLFSFSAVYGQMEDDSPMAHDPKIEFSLLLKDESEFLSNQKSGDFVENFVRKATLMPSNILIKSETSVKLTGTIEREYSTILIEGELKIIDTGDSSLRVQKIIIAPTGSLTIGDNENPIEFDKKVEIVFVKNNDGEVGMFVFGKLLIHGDEINPTFVGVQKHVKKMG